MGIKSFVYAGSPDNFQLYILSMHLAYISTAVLSQLVHTESIFSTYIPLVSQNHFKQF